MAKVILIESTSHLRRFRVVGKNRTSKVFDIRGIPAKNETEASDYALQKHKVYARYIIPEI
jgi:hypothetical protein